MSARVAFVTDAWEVADARTLLSPLRSLQGSTDPRWEWVVVGADGIAPSSPVGRALARESRVTVLAGGPSGPGSQAIRLNAAIGLTAARAVSLLPPPAYLEPETVGLLASHDTWSGNGYVYGDEASLDHRGRRNRPLLRPGWSPERLLGFPYTGSLGVVDRGLLTDIGGFDDHADLAHPFDLALRVAEAGVTVGNIPRILVYTWQPGGGDGTDDAWMMPGSALAAAAARHAERTGTHIQPEVHPELPGHLVLRPTPTSRPLVSVVIPSAARVRREDGSDVPMLETCLRSLLGRSGYPHLDILISVGPEVDEDALRRSLLPYGESVRIVRDDRSFNYARRVNLAAAEARGDYLLTLNDDCEVTRPGWIDSMIVLAERKGVGAVGAKLLYPDGRIQHAGVVFTHGLPGHVLSGFDASFAGYFGSPAVSPGNYMAVTGACVLTSMAAFRSVAGLSEAFPVNYNDIDYCMKLRRRGLRTAWSPDAVLIHHESATRTAGLTQGEVDEFLRRWSPDTGEDPYYHPRTVVSYPGIDPGPFGGRLAAISAARRVRDRMVWLRTRMSS